MHSSIDQFDMPSHDDLSHVFNELHNDITSLCMRNKELKLKVSYLSKEIESWKLNDEKSKTNEENSRRESERLQTQVMT